MSEILKAAEDIVSYASRIRSFLQVADVLKRIGNIEQAEGEAKNRAESARQEADAADAILENKNAQVAKVVEDIEYAKKSAEEIIANANRRAMEIVDGAGVRANEAFRAADEQKMSIEKEISALLGKRDDMLAFISEKESELSVIVAKISEAKEKVASLFK